MGDCEETDEWGDDDDFEIIVSQLEQQSQNVILNKPQIQPTHYQRIRIQFSKRSNQIFL